jgi:hypothetical protein
MEKNIFYSWQSDLPNNTNRTFIEDCIKLAIKDLSNENLHLEIAIDRDTKGVGGTPDISSTIFSKIDKSHVFIADISFINPGYEGRKTPNPNVLVELGYAAKTIGWSNIICVFNNKYGKLEELPFDLKFRRPLTYTVSNSKNKSKDRELFSSILSEALKTIIHSESSKDQIRYYIKQQVDKEIITICNHCFKILNGYGEEININEIRRMLSLDLNGIQEHLFEKKFLGFTVLKDWRIYMSKLEGIMNKPFFTQNAESQYVSSLINVVRSLEVMTSVNSKKNFFIDIDSKSDSYKVIEGKKMNPENPKDEYLLLKKMDAEDQGIVIDFGNIKKYNVDRLLIYQIIEGDNFMHFSSCMSELFHSIENWVDNTGGNLILDPLTFRI